MAGCGRAIERVSADGTVAEVCVLALGRGACEVCASPQPPIAATLRTAAKHVCPPKARVLVSCA